MYLSRNDLEGYAQKIVSEYMRLPKLKIQRTVNKIDPIILAENLIGLKIDFAHLSDDYSVFGLTSYFPTAVEVLEENNDTELLALDGNTILIEKELAFEPLIGKFNFTIAHETSHQILKKLFPTEYGCNTKVHYYGNSIKKPITNWEEWQASTLAAAILMPKEMLLHNMVAVGLGEKMVCLNRRYKQEDFMKFCNLSSIMGVSASALRIRMMQLGLIEKDNYYNSKGIFDVEYEM